MALQGRKPGWLLDKILGREEAPPPAPTETPATEGAPVEPSPPIEARAEPLSPASTPEGAPNFTPAALDPAQPPTPSGVAEAEPVAEPLAGADLQPVVPSPPEPISTEPPPVPHAEVLGEAEPRSTQEGGASFEAGLRPAPQDEEVGSLPPVPVAPPPAEEKRGWFRRLTDGMRRTSSSIGEGVTCLFT